MKFVAVVALIGAAQAADCCINAVDDGNGAFTNDANCAVDPSAACEIPECADANTDTATGNSNGGACTAPAAADPAACTDTAVETDGAWAEADGTACTAAAAEPEGDGAAASTTCETSEDCEGEDMVCSSAVLDSTDKEHADYDEASDAIVQALYPIKGCSSMADCEAF